MNGKDWFLKGLEYYNNSNGEGIQCFWNAIESPDIWYIDKLNCYIKLSDYYFNLKKYDDALYCASVAMSITNTPRADVCCILGDIYLIKSNIQWAIWWFEKAIGNVPFGSEKEGLDENFYTNIPLEKLSKCYKLIGDKEKSEEYTNALTLLKTNNIEKNIEKKEE